MKLITDFLFSIGLDPLQAGIVLGCAFIVFIAVGITLGNAVCSWIDRDIKKERDIEQAINIANSH